MNSKINKLEIGEPAAIKAWAEGRTIYIELTDSRIIGFPANRFKILSKATDHQLKEIKIGWMDLHCAGNLLMKTSLSQGS